MKFKAFLAIAMSTSLAFGSVANTASMTLRMPAANEQGSNLCQTIISYEEKHLTDLRDLKREISKDEKLREIYLKAGGVFDAVDAAEGIGRILNGSGSATEVVANLLGMALKFYYGEKMRKQGQEHKMSLDELIQAHTNSLEKVRDIHTRGGACQQEQFLQTYSAISLELSNFISKSKATIDNLILVYEKRSHPALAHTLTAVGLAGLVASYFLFKKSNTYWLVPVSAFLVSGATAITGLSQEYDEYFKIRPIIDDLKRSRAQIEELEKTMTVRIKNISNRLN